MDAVDHLLAEHREIMGGFEPLRRAVAALEARGEAAIAEALPALAAAARLMATRLRAHARKEDDALFPALERVFGEGAGATAVMRDEHREIHAHAERFRATLRELEEVEHPAILAGGAELAALAAGAGAGAARLAAAARGVLDLLDAHFAKEEEVLFPMAREVLPPEELRAVAARMEALGRE